jgi:hypothetical protein
MGLGPDVATRHFNNDVRLISNLLSDKVIRLPEQSPLQLADAAHNFGKRVTGGKAPAKARLQCAQVQQDRADERMITPVCLTPGSRRPIADRQILPPRPREAATGWRAAGAADSKRSPRLR